MGEQISRIVVDRDGAAVDMCESHNFAAIDELVSLLLKPSLKDRLDSMMEYSYTHFRDLRFTKVLVAIARLPDDMAEAELGRFARVPDVLGVDRRLAALIYAAGEARRPSPFLLRFLDEQATPQNSGGATDSLARVATDESCALLEKRFLSRDYHVGTKTDWLQTELIVVRDRPAVVALYKRLLRSDKVEKELREALVQTLFDYRPKEWFSYEAPPPRWKDCSTSVLEKLLAIADTADKLAVSEVAKAGVARSRF